MRIHVIDSGPNKGFKVVIPGDFLYRGTNQKEITGSLVKHDGGYCGSDDKYGIATYASTDIDGACQYCTPVNYCIADGKVVKSWWKEKDAAYTSRQVLMAIRHYDYELISPPDDGIILVGLIRAEDIFIIDTFEDLLEVCPSFGELEKRVQDYILENIGIKPMYPIRNAS